MTGSRKDIVNIIFSFLLLISLGVPQVQAEVQVKGIGSANYKRKPAKSLPQAIEAAKKDAWNKYTSRFNSARMKQYLANRGAIESSMGMIVQNAQVVDETIDKDAKTISVIVRVSINEEAVNSLLSATSAAGQMESGEGSEFVMIFLARQATSSTRFDEKRTEISKKEGASTAEESMAASGTTMASSQSSSAIIKSTTGGSTTQRSDKIVYDVTSAENVDAAVADVLDGANFETTEYNSIVDDCGGPEMSEFQEQLRDSDEIQRLTRKAAFDAAKDCEVPYWGMGTLDVGTKDIDPVSGNTRVFVNVRVKVYRLKGKRSKRVAVVGPVQFAGLGPNQTVATNNALLLAGKSAAQTIVDKLNAKGLR